LLEIPCPSNWRVVSVLIWHFLLVLIWQFCTLQRAQCKDRLAIYTCCDWQASRTALPTSDAADLAWSPDTTCLAVWESSLDYRLLVIALDGRCLLDYCAYPDGLGIKSVAWSPSGQLLAIGSYDQVR
jgi:WD40 repeat protein